MGVIVGCIKAAGRNAPSAGEAERGDDGKDGSRILRCYLVQIGIYLPGTTLRKQAGVPSRTLKPPSAKFGRI